MSSYNIGRMIKTIKKYDLSFYEIERMIKNTKKTDVRKIIPKPKKVEEISSELRRFGGLVRLVKLLDEVWGREPAQESSDRLTSIDDQYLLVQEFINYFELYIRNNPKISSERAKGYSELAGQLKGYLARKFSETFSKRFGGRK